MRWMIALLIVLSLSCGSIPQSIVLPAPPSTIVIDVNISDDEIVCVSSRVGSQTAVMLPFSCVKVGTLRDMLSNRLLAGIIQ